MRPCLSARAELLALVGQRDSVEIAAIVSPHVVLLSVPGGTSAAGAWACDRQRTAGFGRAASKADAREVPGSINADGQEDMRLRGTQFGEPTDALTTSGLGLIVVVGRATSRTLQRMTQTRNSHQLFDFFVIPVMPGTKQERDAIATVEAFAEIGVTASKVVMISTGLEPTTTLASAFAAVHAYINEEKRAQLLSVAISDSEVYSRLAAQNLTLAAVLADTTDYMAAMRAAKEPKQRLAASQAFSLKRMAESAADELDEVWAEFSALQSAA